MIPAARADRLSTSVVVPTWNRPNDLARCLRALVGQEQSPDQVVVVARIEDEAAQEVARGFSAELPLQIELVDRPGLGPASNVGFDAAEGDIVIRLDDDAEPWPPWLKLILHWFENHPDVGGVCGRDWVQNEYSMSRSPKRVVGRISWTGRVIGNHHLGIGEPRDVVVLKGANMAFRAEALRGLTFDERALQPNRHIHDDAEISMKVRARGWRLIYDPVIAINHYPGARPIADRAITTPERAANEAFRETLAFDGHLHGREQFAYRAWAHVVGSRAAPGVVHVVRSGLRLGPSGLADSARAMSGAFRGRSKGRAALRSDRDAQ